MFLEGELSERRKVKDMKHLVAKIMVMLACAIIMLHAVVPHHHHDCCDAKGLTFETEFDCHCDSDHHHHPGCHHHSHHPFDICLLQDMLSHLVISTSDDHHTVAASIRAESNTFVFWAIPSLYRELPNPVVPIRQVWGATGPIPLTSAPAPDANGLRAPPAFV